ncbi:MAG: NAD(P)-binding domain-containing protein, partial [Rhodobacteraceae bacterium]|nr:NAD(P)-binding domain-containing protein [Paracoccaceae bacterium]
VKISHRNPAPIDYIIHAPDSPISDFTPFTNLGAILSMWAGVENIVHNPTITVPLARMVDPGIVEGMTEWVTGQVLRHHLGFDHHILNTQGEWLTSARPPLARKRTVGILGAGVLGRATARILLALNFNVIGWSRRHSRSNNPTRSRDSAQLDNPADDLVVHTGTQGLSQILQEVDILVLLLPHTPKTDMLLNAGTFGRMKRGMIIINAGRGALIDDDALLDALHNGIVSHATLDVFRQEPLPPDHPFWQHSRISIWPHIAAETRAETAAGVIVANIARHLAGAPLHHQVNRQQGY